MSITDELREYATVSWNPWPAARDRLLQMCDHIDAEHEKCIDAMWEDAKSHLSDESLTEQGWIRLPKDADGEYIHVGDEMEWVRYESDDPTIVRNVSAVGDGVFFAWSDEQGRYAQYEAHAYRHHHAPTVEDVLREFGDWYAHTKGGCDEDGVIASYAKRLTLAEGEDS